MKVLQCNTEYEWHCRRAKLINLHMKMPEKFVLGNATHGSLEVCISEKTLFILRRPPQKKVVDM